MNSKVQEIYDGLFCERAEPFGAGLPDSIVLHIPRMVSGTALDVGAGSGRNGIFLAKRGFRVTLLDISPEALRQAELLAVRSGVSIGVVQGDVRSLPAGEYDAVNVSFVFQLLAPADARAVVNKIQQSTRAGGVNSISFFTPKGDLGLANKGFCPSIEEMKTLYDGWTLVRCEFGKSFLLERKESGAPKTNAKASMLFRRQ